MRTPLATLSSPRSIDGLAREHPQQRRLAGAVAPRDRHPFAALELERDAAQQRLPGDVLVQVGCDQQGHRLLMVGPRLGRPTSGRIRARCAACSASSLPLALLLSLVLAPAAQRLQRRPRLLRRHRRQGRHQRGFILIIFFPLFVFSMSMLQRRLEKRKEARKAAEKAMLGNAHWRGGW